MTKSLKIFLTLLLLFIFIFPLTFLSSPQISHANVLNKFKEGDEVEFQGELDVLIADHFKTKAKTKTHEIQYFLLIEDEKNPVPLIFKNPPPEGEYLSGYKMRVRGLLKRGPSIEVKKLELLIIPDHYSKSSSELELVPRKSLMIIVDLKDALASTRYNKTTLEKIRRETDSTYQTVSFNKVSFPIDSDGDGSVDVVGPFKINYSRLTCDYHNWANAADAAATASGVNLSQYQHRIYILPYYGLLTGCGWAGMGNLGCGSNCRVWNGYSDYSLVNIHELGHNLGMHHSATDPDDNGVIDVEYGDKSDPMGNDYFVIKGFNAPHVVEMNWLSHFPEAIQTVTTDGIYDVYPLHIDPITHGKAQILKIKKPKTNSSYYISNRLPFGVDKNISNIYTQGASLHSHSDDNNFTTQSLYIKSLNQGITFTSGYLKITKLAPSGDLTVTKIKVEFTCTLGEPTVTFAPKVVASRSGETTIFTVKIRNNDTGKCPDTKFRLTSVLPPELNGNFSSDLLAIPMGGEKITYLTITSNGTSGNFVPSIKVKEDGPTPRHPKEYVSSVQLFINPEGNFPFKPGVTYKIYNGSFIGIPNFSTMTPVASGRILNFDVSSRSASKNFAFLFEGFIYLAQSGSYTFYTNSSEGSNLWVSDQRVVLNDGYHAPKERSGSITLNSGWHSIRVEYFDREGNPLLDTYYAGPGISKRVIATSILGTLDNSIIPPQVNAGVDLEIKLPESSIYLRGVGSDPDGGPINFQWEQVSGPSEALFSSPTTAETQVTNLVEGIYQFRLKVSDSEGGVTQDEIQVTVSNNNLPTGGKKL